jgi:hypothetical protein
MSLTGIDSSSHMFLKSVMSVLYFNAEQSHINIYASVSIYVYISFAMQALSIFVQHELSFIYITEFQSLFCCLPSSFNKIETWIIKWSLGASTINKQKLLIILLIQLLWGYFMFMQQVVQTFDFRIWGIACPVSFQAFPWKETQLYIGCCM